MADKIRIILIDTSDAVGGMEMSHRMLLRDLDHEQFEPHVACLKHGPVNALFRTIPNIKILPVMAGTRPPQWRDGWRGLIANWFSLIPLTLTLIQLVRYCRRNKIQVVHTADKRRSLLMAFILRCFLRIPYIYHLRNPYSDSKYNQFMLVHAAFVVANSAATRQSCIDARGSKMERIRVVYNGVDTDRFRPGLSSSFRASLGFGPDDIVIGIANRLEENKGLSVFIDAAARMVCMVPRARFVIVGDNSLGGTNEEYIHTLKGLIEDYGLKDRVKFAGFHSDMEEVYTGLDVLVNPTEWEAFGLVVVEGMACGKVVVASRAGGIPEIITDGRDGFLFPPHNSEKLASILCELISKPELRHNIGLMARQTAIDRFSVHRLTRTIGSIYLDLVEGRCAQQETGCSDQNNRLHVSDNRPKILLLDTSDMVGGVEMAHIMLARTIDRARFDLHVVCLDHGPVLQLFKTLPNLTLIPIAAGTRPAHLRSGWRGCVASVFSLIPLVVSAAQIICYSRRAGIRVVHTADKHRSILFALLLRFLNRIPFIFHIHNGYENSLIKQTALAQASMVIANSKASRQSCIDHLGASMERIRVVYNGIDTDRFKPGLTSNFRVELGAAPGDVIIGITNRLAPNKGQEVFIRAAAIVARAESHARFVIIGEDGVGGASSYACMLRNLVMELGLVDRLIFLGFRSDMEAIFTGLDVLVNPTEWEAFGLVVAEAMACGKVVAGARTGGIPELITHGSNGFLFEPHDEQTLAGILQEIVRKPELRETIGRAARQSIVDCFTIQRLARDVENVYSEVAANKYSQKL